MGHAKEGIAEGVALERGTTSTVRSPRDGHGDAGHFLQLGATMLFEGSGKGTDSSLR